MNIRLLAALFLFFVANCFAAPEENIVSEMTKHSSLSAEEIRLHYLDCDSGNYFSMFICGFYGFTVQDVKLNKDYQELIKFTKKRNPDALQSLIKSQRLWIQYRDETCSFDGLLGAGGGRDEGLYTISCKENLTKERIARIELNLKY